MGNSIRIDEKPQTPFQLSREMDNKYDKYDARKS
jgi:hypothetical protein